MSVSSMKISGTVGYAMPPNKVETVIRPSLVAYARERGIYLVQVNIDQPLVEQGPFDCLIHKVYGDEWKAQLRDFISKYPEVVIIDSPSSIERLHNRVSMFEVVNHLPVPVPDQQSDTEAYSLGIPKQVVINTNDHAQESLLGEGLNFPVIAKPLFVNGTAESHEISLTFSSYGLNKVEPPVVLQEFVSHGGVLFKVYVAGEHVKCVKRKSVPDVHVSSDAARSEDQVAIMPISHISSSAAEDDDTLIKEAEMPSLSFIHNLAKGLREATKLHLFNFDVIRDDRDFNRYLIIDINYLPGYAKVPGFETMLTDFFVDIIIHKNEGRVAAAAAATEVCDSKVGCSSETGNLDRVVKREDNCLTILYNCIISLFFKLQLNR